MNSFPTQDVTALCLELGHLLTVPEGLSGERVMLAIAAVESGGADPKFAGHNCGPRHESAYDVNGGFWHQSTIQQGLVKEWGSRAACSFGPWQMMYCNFAPPVTPDQCEKDLRFCAVEFVGRFNRAMRRAAPKTLAEIGEIWNMGHIGPDPDYVTKLQRAYTATEAVLVPAEKEG